MKVTLAGTGCGSTSTMTVGAVKAMRQADLIIGAERLLEAIPEEWGAERHAAVSAREIRDRILDFRRDEKNTDARICVVFSGDTGFYSGARALIPLLEERGIESSVIPGISSLQMLSARLGIPWQEWKLVSAHGLDCDAAASLDDSRQTFFLTGGKLGPGELCQQLADADMGDVPVVIAERLSYGDERIRRGTAGEFAGCRFDSLSVMLAGPGTERTGEENGIDAHDGSRNSHGLDFRNFRPGLPDLLFVRGDVPMTKREVRAVIAGHMQIREEDILWDIGAGTGSVTVEMAVQAPGGQVYAIEKNPEGAALIKENSERFGLKNIVITEGEAPEALDDLPVPDRVFIGGSGGNMDRIIDIILQKNGEAMVCASAILLETAVETVKIMEDRGMEPNIIQVAVSCGRRAGDRHMMIGGNPIFIITGQRKTA